MFFPPKPLKTSLSSCKGGLVEESLRDLARGIQSKGGCGGAAAMGMRATASAKDACVFVVLRLGDSFVYWSSLKTETLVFPKQACFICKITSSWSKRVWAKSTLLGPEVKDAMKDANICSILIESRLESDKAKTIHLYKQDRNGKAIYCSFWLPFLQAQANKK